MKGKQELVPNSAHSVFGRKYKFHGEYWFERPQHKVEGKEPHPHDVRLNITFPSRPRVGISPEELVLRTGGGASFYYSSLEMDVEKKLAEQEKQLAKKDSEIAVLKTRIAKLQKHLSEDLAKYLDFKRGDEKVPTIFTPGRMNEVIVDDTHVWGMASPPQMDEDALAVNYTASWYNISLLADMIDVMRKVNKYAMDEGRVLVPRYQNLPLIVAVDKGKAPHYYMLSERRWEFIEQRKFELNSYSLDAAIAKIVQASKTLPMSIKLVETNKVIKILNEYREDRKSLDVLDKPAPVVKKGARK